MDIFCTQSHKRSQAHCGKGGCRFSCGYCHTLTQMPATGIFASSVATYILRDSWRSQVLFGALPALLLLLFTSASCESPRWLITQNHYAKAYETLVRLRGDWSVLRACLYAWTLVSARAASVSAQLAGLDCRRRVQSFSVSSSTMLASIRVLSAGRFRYGRVVS